jgi:DNA-directed RNA polymerase subunit RPC12/RpoP
MTKCVNCGNEFKPRMGENFCFNCAMKRLSKLREQSERVDKLLSDNPVIVELLDKLTPEQVIYRLKNMGKERVDFT